MFPLDKDLFFPYGSFFAPEGALRVKVEACFLFLTGALGRLSNQNNNLWDLCLGPVKGKNYHSKPSLLLIKGVLEMACYVFFKFLTAYLVLCLGREEPLNSFCRFFFDQMAAHRTT